MVKDTYKTRKQLLAELDALKQKLAGTRKLEKVLIASNQQLEASEQQLGALNQQLVANEQQLRAANQQLAASNQQLTASDEKFRSVVEASPMGMHFYTLQPDGKLVFSGANPAADVLLGVDNRQFIGKTIEEAFPPLSGTEISEAYKDAAAHGKNWQTEQVIYNDGKISGAFEVYAFQTLPGKMVAVFLDITKQKQIEQKNEHFSRIFKDSLNEIYFFDADSLKFSQANKAARQNLGYSMEELREMTPLTIKPEFTEELFSKVVAPLRNGKKRKIVFETVHKRKDKTLYNVEVHLQLLHFENEDMFAAIILDITARKKAEEKLKASNLQLYASEQQLKAANQQLGANEQQLRAANQQLEASNQQLRESERKFRELFEKSGDSILILENRKFVDCNSATIKLLGYYSKEEFLNTHPSKISPLYQPDGRLSYEKAEEMMDAAIEKRTHRFEWDHLNSNGEIVPVEVLLTAISNEKGKEIIHTVWRDITGQKIAQKKIVDALEKATESDRLKSAFLANMSHEIRTPMNGIIGFTTLLNDPDLNNTERQKYTTIINKSSDRLLNTINDLIDISKIEAGQMKVTFTETSINRLFDELYGFFKPEVTLKGLSLVSLPTLAEPEDTILSDNAKLHGILTNLIKNAIKFTEKGSITFGYYLKDDFIEFFVKDTGIGIPENRQQAIFNRFVQADIEDTRAIEGSGLGLTISKAYVEMLGGKMWMLSEEGKGSSFRFTIPYTLATDQKATPKATGKPLKVLVSRNLELLIVEDEETSSFFLETILKNRFWKISSAKTGKEAIELCRKNPEIDIVLMDIKLPEMNGYEATREIRKFNKEVVIIAQTAFALAGDKKRAIEAGCDDYIPKPIDKEALLEMINHHIKKKKGI